MSEEITIDEAELILVAQQREISRYLKVILLVSVVLFVITIVTVIQGIQFSNTVDDLNQETDDLTVQVQSAQENLNKANDQIEEIFKRSPEIVQDALFAIFRIEQYLCGGHCEDNP